MRNYNIEANEKITRIKAIMITLTIHFALLFGLMYINSEQTEKLLPDFVKEWISSKNATKPVASNDLP